MKPININVAESIIDPFWDPEISSFNMWKVEKENANSISVEQTWCTVSFMWMNCPINKKALSLSREYINLSVKNVDRLIISAALTNGTYMSVIVLNGKVKIKKDFTGIDDKKHEYEVDIFDFSNITELKINITSKNSEDNSGWFNWIGLSDSNLLKEHLDSGSLNEDSWDKHLKPINFEPSFEPSYGILLDNDDIEVLRNMTSNLVAGENPLNKIRSYSRLNDPESHINKYVNFLHDTRYNRERDENNYLLKKGENAAVAGIIQKDPVLLRLASRYALTLASCDKWDDGFLCDFQTSSFNHRCFVQSLCLYECAFILDIAGEFFTDAGRDLILRKMAEEGIGSINFNTWKYEYIFHCNQMAWFSPGRMYGYAVLLRHYPRIEPYMEIAFNDVIENINNTIEADGGYLEGPGYFSCIGRDALLSLYIYASVKNISIKELIPSVMQKTIDFGEVLESTDKMVNLIPICDSSLRTKASFINLYKVHLAFMAYFFPNSVWPDIFYKHIDNFGLGDNPLSWLFYNKVQRKSTYKRRAFLKLSITGHVASYRKGKKGISKILVVGNKAGADHTHMDKGSFVYEYGGETFLMDPGICSYDNPISWDLKSPERHNMLIPMGRTELSKPKNPLMCDVIPEAYGDEESFTARTNLSETWVDSFERWVRTIDSPNSETVIIKDEYILRQGEGVQMVLNSPLEISKTSKFVFITGKNTRLEIEIPDDCSTEIDKLKHPVTKHNRLKIIKKGTKGKICIKMVMKVI